MLTFTAERVAAIRQGKVTAVLVKPTQRVRPDTVRPLRRRFTRHDENGQPIGEVIEPVSDMRDGERVPVVVTILEVRDVDGAELQLVDARACGYRTATGLRDAWKHEHPRLPVARLVRFAVGDLRDRPRFLSSFPARSDYVTNIRQAAPNEPEALSVAELERVAALNGQTHARARADLADGLAARGLVKRLEAIEKAAARRQIDARSELRIVEQRLTRAERRVVDRLR